MRTTVVTDGIVLAPALRKKAKNTALLCLGRYVATLQQVRLTASLDPATKEARVEVRLTARLGDAVVVSAVAPTVEDAIERSLARAARSLYAREPMENSKSWKPKR